MAPRILVVDDDLTSREIIARTLVRAGFEAAAEAEAERALERLKADEEAGRPFDLVFLDLSMPGMDGYEAARLIRARGMLPVLVALSGGAEAGEVAAAGFDGYLVKPLSFERLAAAVKEFGALAESRRGKG